ncbi:short-chain dehydrogenase [Histoplasma ohiense]|nr:short-chain dehydrogenase [Histoplasma ohiense (nom. inval.)]
MPRFATKTVHKKPYAAISPTAPEHSQAGQTVVITGGGGGIGLAIARAFAQAGAQKIILLGRRSEVLFDAVKQLQKEVPGYCGELQAVPCDISDKMRVARFWDRLREENTAVDVLVLNAGVIDPIGDILKAKHSDAWAAFDGNTRANLDMTQRFFNNIDAFPNGKKKSVVHVSSATAADYHLNPIAGTYASSKAAFLVLLHRIAIQEPVEKAQIISFDPGSIYSPGVKAAGFSEHSYDWDDENLPGQFAVWATSSAAVMFHGRFVKSCWDVNELQGAEVKAHIDNDDMFLKMGVIGY